MKTPSSFWSGKRVLVTSANQLLGAWAILSLRHLGAQVFGLASSQGSSPHLFELLNLGAEIGMTYGDLREESLLREVLNSAEADIVLHLGESGSLHASVQNSLDLISKSVLGTCQLMELLRETSSVRALVVVGSDKVYQPHPQNEPLDESSLLMARNILPASKLCSELMALSYRHTYFNPEKYNKHKLALATARIEMGIGGGDFSDSSLIYEAVQSFVAKKGLSLRNPQSVRPWIHVLDQVHGILLLAQGLYEKGPKLAPTYNFGASEFKAVGDVMASFAEAWGCPESEWRSYMVAEGANLSVHSRLNSERAQRDLGWSPQWSLAQMLKRTSTWYQSFYKASDAHSLARDVQDFFV